MSNPYIGEIRMFGCNFAPRGWAFCNGQLLPIAQNTALFSLLGTTYGGNGTTTFGLPDLRGRVPIHFGQGPGLSSYSLGQTGGAESVTLLTTQIPAHSHTVNAADTGGNQTSPIAALPAVESTGTSKNFSNSGTGQMSPAMINPAGGNQPHPNLQPYQTINFCIALEGIYPSRN